MMDTLALLEALHVGGERQGPGSRETTRRAIGLAGLDRAENLEIADFGCGTGAATLELARLPGARVQALDLLPGFIAALEARAAQAGLEERITPLVANMEAPPLGEKSLDVLWSEGAIYNLGFAHGIESWRSLLRPGGILAVSELTWLTSTRPGELDRHWQEHYPEVGTAGEKLALLEAAGYDLIAYFALPKEDWLTHYYGPLRQRFPGFLELAEHSDAAQAIVADEEHEIALYERFSDHVSYGFYIARRAS